MEKANPNQDKQYHIIIDKQPPPKSKSFLGVEYDTLTLIFGFFVPLLSFLLGFLFSILRERINERFELKISSDTLLLWIKKSIKSSEVLLDEIKKKREEVLKLDNFQIKRPDQINLHLSRLTVNQEKIFKAFVKYRKDKKGDNSDDYTKLMVNLDFLVDFQEIFYKNANFMIDDFRKLFDQWNDYLREFHRAKHNLIGKRAPFQRPSHLYSINNLFNKWYSNKEEGLLSTFKFLENLEPFLNELYSITPGDDEVETLLFLTHQIKMVYNQFVHERDTYAGILENEHTQLSKTIKEIEGVSGKIGKKKFVLI